VKLNGFELAEVVGDGRTGRIFHATRESDGAPVAFRQVKPRLAREEGVADALLALEADATFDHPSLVPVLASFQVQQAICIVEPLVTGPTLKARLEQGALPSKEVLKLAQALVGGLEELETKGLVHGDITPANIVLTEAGPRLTGVGVALRARRRKMLRQSFGDAYDAPELTSAGATASTDRFALAMCLHEALHGEVQWRVEDATDELETALLKGRENEEGDRHPSAVAFRRALLAAEMGGSTSRGIAKPRAEAAADRSDGFEAPMAPREPDLDLKQPFVMPAWAPKAAAGFGAAIAVILLGRFLIGLLPDTPDGMFAVPSGSVQVGDAEGPRDERPGFTVRHDRFFMDRAEVTAAEFALCATTGDCLASPERKGLTPTSGDEPVVGVTWLQARGYCVWAGKRLPSENEWEAAAAHVGGLYPWGDERPDCARARYGLLPEGACPGEATPAVVPAGRGEVAHLAGNAWEYTDSDYEPSRRNGSGGASTGGSSVFKVIKGGAFSSPPDDLRRAARMGVAMDHWAADVGFRCVSDPG